LTLRIPRWALILLGVVAVAAVAFLVGRLTSDDDEGGESAETAATEQSAEADPARTIAMTPDGDRVTRIGDLDVAEADPQAARAVFGRESLITPSRSTCVIAWGEIGLEIVFANFGGSNACGPDGAIGTASMGSEEGVEEGWTTESGLALGDGEAELRELYPRAQPFEFPAPNPQYEGERLVLASAFTPIGEGGDTPTVTAVVADGEVIAFELYVGAAGE
jgi:hypothetical protein